MSIRIVKMVFLSLVFVGVHGLFATWNPEDVFDANQVKQLQDEKFQQVKTSVKSFLKNSWCSEDKATLLMDLIAMTKPQVCVEIGACTGSSVLPVAATLRYVGAGTIFAIDAWSNDEAVKNLALDDINRVWWSKVNMLDIKSIFDTMVSSWDLSTYCKVIQKPSREAITDLPDIDFLHIDGNFSEEGSIEDVTMYLPKVKSRAIMLVKSRVFLPSGPIGSCRYRHLFRIKPIS